MLHHVAINRVSGEVRRIKLFAIPRCSQNFKISWDPFRAKDEEQASTSDTAPLQQFVFVQISTNSREREREKRKKEEKKLDNAA